MVHCWQRPARTAECGFSMPKSSADRDRCCIRPQWRRRFALRGTTAVCSWPPTTVACGGSISSAIALRYHLAHASGVAAAALSPDGRWLATAGRATHDSILITDVANPSAAAQVAVSSEPHGALHAIAFSHDGSKIASGGDDRTVQIWDAATGRRLAGPFNHPQTVRSVQFSPDGTRLIAC